MRIFHKLSFAAIPLLLCGCAGGEVTWKGYEPTDKNLGLIATSFGHGLANDVPVGWAHLPRAYVWSATDAHGVTMKTVTGNTLAVPEGSYYVTYWIAGLCDINAVNCPDQFHTKTVTVKARECHYSDFREEIKFITSTKVQCEDNWITQPNGALLKGQPICKEYETHLNTGTTHITSTDKIYPLSDDNKSCIGVQ